MNFLLSPLKVTFMDSSTFVQVAGMAIAGVSSANSSTTPLTAAGVADWQRGSWGQLPGYQDLGNQGQPGQWLPGAGQGASSGATSGTTRSAVVGAPNRPAEDRFQGSTAAPKGAAVLLFDQWFRAFAAVRQNGGKDSSFSI